MLVNGVTISDEWIDKQCELLDISIEEAVQMYLADNGIVENEEQTALDEKAKKIKINTGAALGKERKKVERKREPNTVKREIISMIATELHDWVAEDEDDFSIENIKITNVEKYIDFTVGERSFTINLVEHRKKK